jgi:hypothetical protein
VPFILFPYLSASYVSAGKLTRRECKRFRRLLASIVRVDNHNLLAEELVKNLSYAQEALPLRMHIGAAAYRSFIDQWKGGTSDYIFDMFA